MSSTRNVYKWPVALLVLVAAYIGCQMLADITAVKLVSMLGVIIPGGTFVYAATFTIRDALHRRYGIQAARVSIWMAAIINVVMALYFTLTIGLPAPAFWNLQDAYKSILGIVPGIVIASILAEIVSELVDTEVYQFAWDTFAKKSQAARIFASNLVSIPIDSTLFATLAFVVWPMLFGGSVPLTMPALWAMIVGQTVFKWVVSFVVVPFTLMITPARVELKPVVESAE